MATLKNPVPDDVKVYLPCKCSRVRNDNGIYRVYKYQAVKLSSGKWTSGREYLIGKIIPGEGFSPNKRYIKEKEELSNNNSIEKYSYSNSITDVEFGGYALLIKLTPDVEKRLQKYFPLEKAEQIYCFSLILTANGFIHIDQVNDFYEYSYLSLKFSEYTFKMGKDALSTLLENLGSCENPVQDFEQSLIDESSKNIAIDGHVVRSCSENNDLSEPGYKSGLLKASQINILIAYDIKHKNPILYRTYRGSSVDKKSVKDFLISWNFINVKFIVDRGFFSKDVLELMSTNGNCYIIPLPSNTKNFKRIKKNLKYTSGSFVYRPSNKKTAYIVYYEEQIDDKTRIIFYKDNDENIATRKSYKIRMANGEKGYTQEGYDKNCEWWGVLALQTTTNETAEEVYYDYKGRWSIETYNNYIKNDADFNDLKIQSYYIQHGFDFIMLVSGLIYSKLDESVKSLKMSNVSTSDVMIKAKHLKLGYDKNNTVWRLRNDRTKDLELLAKMGFSPKGKYRTGDL